MGLKDFVVVVVVVETRTIPTLLFTLKTLVKISKDREIRNSEPEFRIVGGYTRATMLGWALVQRIVFWLGFRPLESQGMFGSETTQQQQSL